MKKRSTGKTTFSQIKGTLGEFGEKLNEFGGQLNEFGERLTDVGESLAFVVEHMATKEDLFVLQTQVNNIESDIRTMKQARLEVRVADLEEKVFRKAR